MQQLSQMEILARFEEVTPPVDATVPYKNRFCKDCFEQGLDKPCMRNLGLPQDMKWGSDPVPPAEVVKLPIDCEECQPNWIG